MSATSRGFRPRLERLESHALLSAIPTVAHTLLPVNLKPTPIATDAKIYLAASTPSSGRQSGTINSLVANPLTRTVTGTMTISYRVKLIPSYLSFINPTSSFQLRVYFTTSLDAPNPADVRIAYTRGIVPFGGDVRDKVALGMTAFIRHDHDRIAASLG